MKNRKNYEWHEILLSDASRLHHQTWWNFAIREFFLISEWCPCNWKVEELINSKFAKHKNDGQYTLKLRPVTWKLLIRKCSRWLIIVTNYQRGNLYSFTCRKACSIHKIQKRLLLSYLMEKTLSLNDDESGTLDGDNIKHI